MIRIAINPAAYAAIAATLPGSVGVVQQRAPNGDYFILARPGGREPARGDARPR